MVILRAWSAWSTSSFSTGCTSVWRLHSTRVELDQFLYRWTKWYNHPYGSTQNWWRCCNGHFASLVSLINIQLQHRMYFQISVTFYIQLALNLISLDRLTKSCIIIYMVARKIDDYLQWWFCVWSHAQLLPFLQWSFCVLDQLDQHPTSAQDLLPDLCDFYFQLALNLISFCSDGRSCIIIHMSASKIDDVFAMVILRAWSAWSNIQLQHRMYFCVTFTFNSRWTWSVFVQMDEVV